jgi:uncharacterized membrane protein YcaP (DUF421 family)
MDILQELWGEGKDLNALQMGVRAVCVFMIGLVLIRFTGRRSFGMHMPFDNVITILMGAILSNAITGKAPFLPVLCAATVLAGMHRLFAWIGIYSDIFGRLVKGDPKVLFKDGRHHRENMKRSLVTDEDLVEGIRLAVHTQDLDKVKEVYIERDGRISAVKKEHAGI